MSKKRSGKRAQAPRRPWLSKNFIRPGYVTGILNKTAISQPEFGMALAYAVATKDRDPYGLPAGRAPRRTLIAENTPGNFWIYGRLFHGWHANDDPDLSGRVVAATRTCVVSGTSETLIELLNMDARAHRLEHVVLPSAVGSLLISRLKKFARKQQIAVTVICEDEGALALTDIRHVFREFSSDENATRRPPPGVAGFRLERLNRNGASGNCWSSDLYVFMNQVASVQPTAPSHEILVAPGSVVDGREQTREQFEADLRRIRAAQRQRRSALAQLRETFVPTFHPLPKASKGGSQ